MEYLARYFSFDGRLARLPFCIRIIYLGIASWLLFLIGIPLFSSGTRLGYWSGLIIVARGSPSFAQEPFLCLCAACTISDCPAIT
jgi:uncharacterized membrane protein YhaH (DUF805 family)